jgi:hypothetical protein
MDLSSRGAHQKKSIHRVENPRQGLERPPLWELSHRPYIPNLVALYKYGYNIKQSNIFFSFTVPHLLCKSHHKTTHYLEAPSHLGKRGGTKNGQSL